MLKDIITYIKNNYIAIVTENLIGIIFSVLLTVFAFFHRRIWNKVRETSIAITDRLEDKIREEVAESFIRNNLPEISHLLRQDLENELQKLQPPPLPQGVSGTPCPQSGLYYSQQFPEEKKVFEKEETFTEAQNPKGCYVKTYWVREEPVSHPGWARQW